MSGRGHQPPHMRLKPKQEFRHQDFCYTCVCVWGGVVESTRLTHSSSYDLVSFAPDHTPKGAQDLGYHSQGANKKENQPPSHPLPLTAKLCL